MKNIGTEMNSKIKSNDINARFGWEIHYMAKLIGMLFILWSMWHKVQRRK